MAGRRSWRSPNPRYGAVPMPIQPAPGAAVLPRHFPEGKKRAEDGLLAIEVELVGVGETAADPLTQVRPARRIGASGETLYHLPFPGDQLLRSERPTGGTSNHPAKKLRQQLLAGSIRLFRVGAGELVGKGMELGDLDARNLRKDA